MPETKRTQADIDADLAEARERFKGLYEDERPLRDRLKRDHEYVDGVYDDGTTKRWDQETKSARGDRPMLHIDAMGPLIAQVVNGLAEGRPAADMFPLGGGSDDEKAEVWEGLIRRVQTSPEAEYAGAYAAEHLTKLGRGYWVVTARYPDYNGKPDDPANWEMELCREHIDNQHAVWLGPAQRPDGSDRLYGFILRPLTKEQFDAEYGEGEFEANQSAFRAEAETLGAAGSCWSDGTRRLTVASYYRVKTRPVTITGTGVDGQPVQRQVQERYCCLSTQTATKEYAYSELPIPYVPIVMGEARRSNVDGAVDVKGMVRAMRHPQDLLNLWPSYIQETIALAARQEVIAAEGQITNQNAKFWDMTKRMPWRLYTPVDVNGVMVERPSIQTYEAPIQAMTLALQQAEGFVRKAAGAYDADSDQTGASRSKESGVARQTRIQQSELGNSDLARAYAFMILFEVKLLMAWAPHVYSSARVLRILGRDEQPKVAVTHFGQAYAEDAQQMAGQLAPGEGQTPIEMVFDLGTGRYDVKARVVKNPLTQRQENADMMRETIPALPPEMQAQVFPIYLEEQEGTMAKKIAAALKPKEGTVSVQEAQKAQQMIDLLTQQVEQLQQQMDAKAQETASREKIAAMDNQTKLEIERMKIAADLEKAKLDLLKLELQAKISAAEAQRAHDRDMESGDHAAAREFALREPEEGAQA